jgi:hypothetical protein
MWHKVKTLMESGVSSAVPTFKPWNFWKDFDYIRSTSYRGTLLQPLLCVQFKLNLIHFLKKKEPIVQILDI